ncbi:MAG TPA: 4-hydroxythreonine-4-phosphate dehydrogenase PdxA, partial [Asticcacaulis sp.]|nr:4-hydroxythreonine-4-phosphate dehydrogenase PdxA [Asticcacaulis sp.]
MTSVSPPLVVSLGDPCGIGPEVVAKAWQALHSEPDLAFCALGDAGVLAAHGVQVTRIATPAEAVDHFAKGLPVLDRSLSQPAVPGQPDAAHAPHIIDWIREGVALCRGGAARGLVTAPIAKSV